MLKRKQKNPVKRTIIARAKKAIELDLDKACKDYLKIKRNIKELEAAANMISQSILAEMNKRNIQKSEYGDGTVYVSNHIRGTYTDEFNDKISKLKEKEEKEGRVEFVSKPILKSRLKNS